MHPENRSVLQQQLNRLVFREDRLGSGSSGGSGDELPRRGARGRRMQGPRWGAQAAARTNFAAGAARGSWRTSRTRQGQRAVAEHAERPIEEGLDHRPERRGATRGSVNGASSGDPRAPAAARSRPRSPAHELGPVAVRRRSGAGGRKADQARGRVVWAPVSASRGEDRVPLRLAHRAASSIRFFSDLSRYAGSRRPSRCVRAWLARPPGP